MGNVREWQGERGGEDKGRKRKGGKMKGGKRRGLQGLVYSPHVRNPEKYKAVWYIVKLRNVSATIDHFGSFCVNGNVHVKFLNQNGRQFFARIC